MLPDMPPTGPSATLWLRAAQIPLARRLAAGAGLTIRRAGGPETGQTARIAAELSAEPVDDLRVALASAADESVILLDASGLGAGEPWSFQERVLTAARARGARVITLEPLPASLLELSDGVSQARRGPDDEPESEDPAARLVPDLVRPASLGRLDGALRAMLDEWAASGSIRSLTVESVGDRDSGSLGMRLWDAMDLVALLMGEPDAIYGVYSGVDSGRNLHVLPGEGLRGLHGDLTANLRFADGRGATVLASDQARVLCWRLTAVGPGGVLRAQGPAAGCEDAAGALAPGVGMLARGDDRHLEGIDVARVLSMAQAALLSARTGEPESPDLVRRMAGG